MLPADPSRPGHDHPPRSGLTAGARPGRREGIQDDSRGDVWIVEDVGGASKPGTTAKRPNSFVYRYVPARPGDLAHGRLQALQVLDHAGQPITFASQAPLDSPDQVALHTYHKRFATRWITLHDTAVDGGAPFDANDLAKQHDATPFKRPENGQFRSGTGFRGGWRWFYTAQHGDNATYEVRLAGEDVTDHR